MGVAVAIPGGEVISCPGIGHGLELALQLPASRGHAPPTALLAAGAGTPPAIAISAPTGAALIAPAFADIWLDQIHVIPRIRELGFVLSETSITVYVWNAYLSRSHVLSTIDVEGPAGIGVTDGYGTPAHFGPGHLRAYTVTADDVGAAYIDNAVIWGFVGIDPDLTTLLLTGIRVVPFPLEPNMRDGLRERYGFLTDVLVAHDETEQRRQLRAVPLRGITMTVTTLEPEESAYLESLVFGWQDRAFGVPLWWDAMPLDAPLSIGEDSIAVDTVGRDFEAGGLVIVWQDHLTWEVFTVGAVNAASLDVTSEATANWSAGASVIPLRLARLPNEVTVERPSVDVAEVELDFDVEAVES